MDLGQSIFVDLKEKVDNKSRSTQLRTLDYQLHEKSWHGGSIAYCALLLWLKGNRKFKMSDSMSCDWDPRILIRHGLRKMT